MSEPYYKPCRELDICNELIEKHFHTQKNNKWFSVIGGFLKNERQEIPPKKSSDFILKI